MTELTDDQCEQIRREPGTFHSSLSDRQICDIWINMPASYCGDTYLRFARLIEEAHGIFEAHDKKQKPYPWVICGENNNE